MLPSNKQLFDSANMLTTNISYHCARWRQQAGKQAGKQAVKQAAKQAHLKAIVVVSQPSNRFCAVFHCIYIFVLYVKNSCLLYA